MQFLNGITLLLFYQLLGEVIARLFDLPVPGPVLGMLLLFVTLVIRGRTPEAVEQTSNGLLGHLSLLFVPAGVGLMAHFHRIEQAWLPIVLALVLSTLLTMVVTALVMQLAMRWLVKTPAQEAGRDD